MATINFSNPIFQRSVNNIDQVDDHIPIVVFAGRSNVGKSSVINLLCGGRFARVSRTPGRTRMINLFELGDVHVADFPGYGYAAAPREERKWWVEQLPQFLQYAPIFCLVLIIDSRRGIGKMDQQLLDFCASRDFHILMVFNKSDKLNNQQKINLMREYKLHCYTNVLCSVLKKQGVSEIRQYIIDSCSRINVNTVESHSYD